MVGMMNLRTNILRKNSHTSALDRTDIAILGLLQNDARLSVKEIAAKVGLAPSSTHERIRRMWDDGVLRGTHVEVDPRALGVGLEGLFMIELSKHKRGTVDRLRAARATARFHHASRRRGGRVAARGARAAASGARDRNFG